MASNTTHTCDQCGKPVSELYGPLFVEVRSLREPQCNANLDVCSWECLAKWAATRKGLWAKPPIPVDVREGVPCPRCGILKTSGHRCGSCGQDV